MNTLTSCNCYSQFKNVYDYIGHYESKHLPEGDWKRVTDIEQLEKSLENCTDSHEKEKIQEHLNTIYNQPLRMSLFFKLNPYPPEHQIVPHEKKPITLQFTNYRKRPAQNPPTISITPKKSAKNINNSRDSISNDQSLDEKKYRCNVEGCTKSYKNSAGLRSHMKSVHKMSSQENRTSASASPAPQNYASNAHISYQPSNQGYYAPKSDEIKTLKAQGQPTPNNSIGSLATFNTATSRLHGSEEGFVQPATGAGYRAGSRLTPSEENILNRNLTNLSAAPQRSTTPLSNLQPATRLNDGKFKCEFCPKTYKTNANLQKHITDHHSRQISLDLDGNSQRPVLSKNVLRTYSISSNQPGASVPTQPNTMSSVQQAKNTLLTKSNVQSGARSPASSGMLVNSPNQSPAPHISVQSPAQRQIAAGNQPNVQQRTYVQTRNYTPIQAQTQNQPVYHLQQIPQQSGDTPQSLDIQIPQNQNSPQNYGSSPVTVVLQPHQQQGSPTIQSQQMQSDHYPQNQTQNVRPPPARTYNSQQYYERYQNSAQRRPSNKTYSTGNYAYQPKQIKQVYRQTPSQDYPRLANPASGQMNRVNTVSSTGQPVRIMNQSGGPMSSSSMMGQGHMSSSSNNSMISNSSSPQPLPTTYQVRSNFDNSRRSPQVSTSTGLSSQLTPLNVNYGSSSTNTTTVDGIQITKVTPSQYSNNPRIRASSGAIRGRLPENVRGAGHTMYNQAIPPRYGSQGMPQYTQRIMRVVQNQQNAGNPPVLQQEGSQRIIHHQNTPSQHPPNSSDS